MQVFYSTQRSGDFFILNEEESKHCIRVLRKKEGDRIHLLDGEGGFYLGEIYEANKHKTTVKIITEEHQGPFPGMQTIIAVAPTKNMTRLEWFIEKATEIGVGEFHFFFAQHSERVKLRMDRLEKVVLSACKQSLKAKIPNLHEAVSFSDLVKKYADFDGQKYIAHCQKGEQVLLKDTYQRNTPIIILIGPEGDFAPAEIQLALDSGFQELTLGESRLRTETAALVACHSIQFLDM
jgi:16S rRNA (uracil1498-N3)-methyltransferase